jgi:hypothetical protein
MMIMMMVVITKVTMTVMVVHVTKCKALRGVAIIILHSQEAHSGAQL